jgi:hypothetical protein
MIIVWCVSEIRIEKNSLRKAILNDLSNEMKKYLKVFSVSNITNMQIIDIHRHLDIVFEHLIYTVRLMLSSKQLYIDL